MEHGVHMERLFAECGVPEQCWCPALLTSCPIEGGHKKEGDGLFSRVCCNRMRGNDFKLKEGTFTPGLR